MKPAHLKRIRDLAAGQALYFACLRVHAQTSADSASDTLGGANLMQGMLSLVAVIATILVLAWIARRFMQGVGVQSSVFRVVASHALGPRERLVLIQVGEKQVLLGVAPGQVSSLQPLDAPLTVSKAESEVPRPGADAGRAPADARPFSAGDTA